MGMLDLLFRRYPEVEKANAIPSRTRPVERECLARLARHVPANGLIVEVGCLYGGTTAVLCLAAPRGLVYSIDNFGWEPDGPCNPEVVRTNLGALGIQNAIIYKANSVEFAPAWNHPIDLLWIDGNHHRFFVECDLRYLAPHAKVMAIHDYGEPLCPEVKPVVDEYMANGEWRITEVAATVAVLQRTRPTRGW